MSSYHDHLVRRALWGVTLIGCVAVAACQGTPSQPVDTGAEDPEPSGPAYLRNYKESYYRSLGNEIVDAPSESAVLDEARELDVLFLGDHHRDAALHGRHLDLLARLHDTGVPMVLGVECVGTEDEPALRGFLSGRFGLDELRRQVQERWPESWLDNPTLDAAFYSELLEFARRTQTPVFALEPVPRLPLDQRDRAMADRIRETAMAHPDRLIVPVVGHAHLLGYGDLVGRVGLSSMVIGARPSVTLSRDMAAIDADTGYVRTDTGVILYAAPSN